MSEVLKDVEALVELAHACWLAEKRDAFLDDQHDRRLTERRANRRARLELSQTSMARVAQIDAQIALLLAAPNVPERDRFLKRLQAIRTALLKQAKP